ncbi:MAG: hypothetical protein OEW13_11800, partial [Nitrospira sp.]|nr:hypothetical protein [Nitrospira sp.]
MGRVEQLIAHLEILCKRGAINIGQAPSRFNALSRLSVRMLSRNQAALAPNFPLGRAAAANSFLNT